MNKGVHRKRWVHFSLLLFFSAPDDETKLTSVVHRLLEIALNYLTHCIANLLFHFRLFFRGRFWEVKYRDRVIFTQRAVLRHFDKILG